MKKLILLIAIAASLFTAQAGTFEASLFGSYDNDQPGEFGSGVALTYFITPHLGIMAEAQNNGFENFEQLKLNGAMVIRYPNKSRWTPYAYVGAGIELDYEVSPIGNEDKWHAFAGLGVSYRLNETISIFADARQNLYRTYSNDASFRSGLTFGF